MRRIFYPAAAAAFLATTSVAFAAQMSGTVKAIDSSHHTLTLQNNDVFQLPSNWSDSHITAGKPVQITYEMQNGKRMASSVTLKD